MTLFADTLWGAPGEGNRRAENAEGDLDLSFGFHGLSCHRWCRPACQSSKGQSRKIAAVLTKSPPPGTNSLLCLHSPEWELKQLQELPIKLRRCVSVLLTRGVWELFSGSCWNRCERKLDWISCLNGTQIHHSDRSVGFRHFAWAGDSLKQTFVSLWLVWMSQIQSIL